MNNAVFFFTGLMAVALAGLQLWPTLKYGFEAERNVPEAMRKYPHSRIHSPKAFWLHVGFLVLWLVLGLYFVLAGVGLV